MENPPHAASDGISPVVQDCWNTIGVQGDNSCPELVHLAHCRNCSRYSAAAFALLDRYPAAEYGSEPSDRVAAASDTARDTKSAIVFRLGTEWFALPTLAFDEVVQQRTICPLPHRRGGVIAGVVNIRGEILICVSLKRILGLGDTAALEPVQGDSARSRVLVVRCGGGRLAFPVDEVQHAHRYQPGELKPPPATVAKAEKVATRAILPWHGRSVGLLDPEAVLGAASGGIG
jgi:chemotaxis-related protein WspD